VNEKPDTIRALIEAWSEAIYIGKQSTESIELLSRWKDPAVILA
jgi:hypothetical protein